MNFIFFVVIYGSHIEYVYDICTQKREILTEHSQLASPTMITTVIHLLLNDKRRNKYVSGDLPLSTHADPTRGQRAEQMGQRTGHAGVARMPARASWPVSGPARVACALTDL